MGPGRPPIIQDGDDIGENLAAPEGSERDFLSSSFLPQPHFGL